MLKLAACMLAWPTVVGAQTFVVDAAGGPGSQFTSIAAAIAAVPDGATLLVRAGVYQPFVLDAKGLTVLADPGTQVSGSCTVRNTAWQQPVVLRGIDFTAVTPGATVVLEMHDCIGTVVLEQLTTPPVLPPQPAVLPFYVLPRGLGAMSCEQLVVRECTLSSCALSLCATTIEASILRGIATAQTPTGVTASATEGLLVGGGITYVAATQLIGGDGAAGFHDAAGLSAGQATVSVRAGEVRSGSGAGATGSWAVSSISSTVRLAPTTTVSHSIGLPFLGPVTIVAMPSVDSTSAAPGATMQANVSTAIGDGVVLLLGLPGQLLVVPGLPETWWFEPAAVFVQAVGVQQPGAPVTGTVAVPATTSLRGTTVAWQALTIQAGALDASNPSFAIVR